MQIDLRTDAYEIANEELKSMGYYFNKHPLVTKDLPTILLSYFSVMSRLPPQIKWKVEKSSYLNRSINENLADSDVKKGLTKSKIKKAIDHLKTSLANCQTFSSSGLMTMFKILEFPKDIFNL